VDSTPWLVAYFGAVRRHLLALVVTGAVPALWVFIQAAGDFSVKLPLWAYVLWLAVGLAVAQALAWRDLYRSSRRIAPEVQKRDRDDALHQLAIDRAALDARQGALSAEMANFDALPRRTIPEDRGGGNTGNHTESDQERARCRDVEFGQRRIDLQVEAERLRIEAEHLEG
jgi:hypothetical protein